MILLLLAGALYVGNPACEPCHSEIVRNYSTTPMALSSGRVSPGDLLAGNFRHEASSTNYRITPDGTVHVTSKGTTGDWKLDYFIGSGASGKSFLFNLSGFVYQAPITWYAEQGRWDASPGYENDTVSRWSRAVEPECLACHSSQVRAAAEYQNLYADPPFAQNGIGCERCHGPGSEHIAGRAKMVNPAKLEPAPRDSVCAQCHMSGEARIERQGKRFLDYRPGQLLATYASYFVYQDSTAVKATSYVERLAGSRCKMASGDRLWCGTCHDPHQSPAGEQRISWYQAKCQTCHAQKECTRGPDCAACHMPKSPVQDVAHGVLSDHSIPRLPKRGSPMAKDWRLRPFSEADAGARELGLAYAEVFQRSGDSRQEAEAFQLLSKTPRDPDVELRLAAIYQHRGNLKQSIELYQAVLQADPNSVVALVNLGNAYGSLGAYGKAIASWRRALTRNPCQAEAVANLGKVFQAGGDSRNLKLLQQSQARCYLSVQSPARPVGAL